MESELEVEAPTGLQVAPQPDENKYYIGGGRSDNPLFVPTDQSNHSQAKSAGRAIWILAVIVVVSLALAVGGGLGVGLHESSLSRSPQLSLFVFLSSAFSITYFFSPSSHTPTASTKVSNVSVTIVQASHASHASTTGTGVSDTPVTTIRAYGVNTTASNPPQQSSSSTSTPAPPQFSTTTAPPTFSQTSDNDKGSSLCSSISRATCQDSYGQYNDTYLYKARTSYILASGVNSVANELFSSADEGCAAIWTCQSDAEFAVGMTGAQIKAAFEFLYQDASVEVCGSSYLSNGCHVTANMCDDCEPTVPCGSLSAENIANNYPCYT